MTVRIVSYNLLVPIFADQPESFTKSQREFVKTDYRWNLIRAQLEQEITHHENTIICLQELSLCMLPKLELFFHQLKYSFFNNLYGPRYSDYMGVGIAIPDAIQLQSISYTKIGQHIRSVSKPLKSQTNLFTWVWDLYQFALSKFIKLISDPWETAIARDNTLICLQLIINGKPLCVGTYHMPCLYKVLAVMAIHSSIVKDLMYQFADGQDFILAGDFNFKPYDASYQALIEKSYIDVNFPKSDNYEISYRPNIEQVLKSAYREKNGSEPVYTNFVDSLNTARFCETLDYIFFVGHLTVENVLELPDNLEGVGVGVNQSVGKR
ncbi:unnamed protein product [Adineta steineri]|uniref:Endonuclease/exonuclease/phosphatase domain-containing protein n=1 Tax=Adineta steineri TaxID=433720 RepID=A0A815BRX1_9BILA|nr:unnamed protein product [Adineta steineri]CAF4017185.1 unnamed protein product [Adineta steineri]